MGERCEFCGGEHWDDQGYWSTPDSCGKPKRKTDVQQCKYCGAKVVKTEWGCDHFACGSSHYTLRGGWCQPQSCCEAEKKAKQEPPTECQWCGAGVRGKTPSATHYACNSSWWHSETAWELSKKCMARCAEQLLKIRKGQR